MELIGPFKQILPLTGLAMKGSLSDASLRIIPNGGILVEEGKVVGCGDFEYLRKNHPQANPEYITEDRVLLPGFIDCHTHICFAGSRAKDYSMRISGRTYQEIAQSGGGIWDSVTQTRLAGLSELSESLIHRAARHLKEGVTTIEVKSGYGLSVEHELKQLQAIKTAAQGIGSADLVTTCLAAHIKPKDFEGNHAGYLAYVLHELLPEVRKKGLASRVDIFIEEGAFGRDESLDYLMAAKKLGFDLTVHADQFTRGGSIIAIKVGALSADHLEASAETEIAALAGSDTVAVVLPGASLGLGMPFAPARKLLDAGSCLAIASDWNPGSAPMGDLLAQAAILGASEQLSAAETFAGITFRAAKALKLYDRGALGEGMIADMQAYPCSDYREILYHQGKLKPVRVWKNGRALS